MPHRTTKQGSTQDNKERRKDGHAIQREKEKGRLFLISVSQTVTYHCHCHCQSHPTLLHNSKPSKAAVAKSPHTTPERSKSRPPLPFPALALLRLLPFLASHQSPAPATAKGQGDRSIAKKQKLAARPPARLDLRPPRKSGKSLAAKAKAKAR